MAKLYFRYGAMNCGKSTALLQTAFNYKEKGMMTLVIKPATDSKGGKNVVSRIGAKLNVDYIVGTEEDLFEYIKKKPRLSCVLVDEAQFLTSKQVDQLFNVAVSLDIPVICYGLRTDLKTTVFSGASRLLQIAHSLEELKTICRCGKKAILNARKLNDKFTSDGDQVAIDGDKSVSYESLCGSCYIKLVGPISTE